MSKALKVYYCRDCGTRMPLYYKKDQPFRDDNWKYCISCNSMNLFTQTEVWDYKREQTAQKASTPEQKNAVLHSAELWGKSQCGIGDEW